VPLIKILYVVDNLEPGGAQHCVLDLASYLDRGRFSAHVCSLQGGGVLAGKLVERGIPFWPVYTGVWWSPHSLAGIRSLIREHGIHIVHTHMEQANLAGRLGAVLAGTRVICAHHYSAVLRGGGVRRAVERRLARRTDRVFCTSNEVRAARLAAGGEAPELLEVFHGFIEPADYQDNTSFGAMKAELGFPADVPTVAVIGRLEAAKNHELFLQAAKRLVEEDPAIHFAIVGEGPLRDSLRARVQEMGLSAYVTFAGQRSDMARVYRALDTVVLCSKREGFGKVILEAQAAGVPVVALDVGGVSEVLARGGGYLLSEATPEAFAVAIDHAIQPENRRQIQAQARENVAHFSATRQITQLEDTYATLCEEKRAFQVVY